MDKPARLILDTNLWISYLISNRLINLDGFLEQGKVRLLFSEELLQEFMEVARRPKFSKYFSVADISQLLDAFDYFGELVEVTSEVNICRDPKDNFLLALAKDGQADYLITGDNDLLELKQFELTKIVAFSDIEMILK